ncbi:Protein CBG06273 [Caenorhabditis briggsae]|uniref:Protein CBG06273 n=1 Tax=Caenorhabditis briggsae TaxID=6238 RepID=A8X0H2_CAEBR|nr:Protein CBG06273 [Caenorhabditis briggsae]CAP26132.2 Protein CBG06273 [Caenorhabditis briggsae]
MSSEQHEMADFRRVGSLEQEVHETPPLNDAMLNSAQDIDVLDRPPTPQRTPRSSNAGIKSNYDYDDQKWDRWFVLIMFAILNFSNIASWHCIRVRWKLCQCLFSRKHFNLVKLSAVYMLISIPIGFWGMWLGGIAGVRGSLLIAAFANVRGALIRTSSGWSFNGNDRGSFVLIGQGFAAVSYPFLMYLPSTISNTYFPRDQRTIATTIGFSVESTWNLDGQSHLASDSSIISRCCYAKPSIARYLRDRKWRSYFRSRSKEVDGNDHMGSKVTYHESIKACFKNPTYVILFFSLGGGIGMFNSLYAKMFDMLCPVGRGNLMAGLCVVVMITSGVIGSVAVGFVIDRKKCYREAVMALMCGAVISGIAFIWLTNLEGKIVGFLLIVFACTLGACGLAAYPVGLELALEATYPVASEVASGLIVIFGQLFGLFFILILQNFSKIIGEDDTHISSIQVCGTSATEPHSPTNSPKKYTAAFVIIIGIAMMFATLTVFIQPEYKRSAVEGVYRKQGKQVHYGPDESNPRVDVNSVHKITPEAEERQRINAAAKIRQELYAAKIREENVECVTPKSHSEASTPAN